MRGMKKKITSTTNTTTTNPQIDLNYNSFPILHRTEYISTSKTIHP